MKIIAIEGSDGVGKSTQSEILLKNLSDKGYRVYFEHFPRYGSPIGQLIYEMLNGKKEMPSFDAMQMLYAADQTDFKNKIKELEEEGYDYLILDRYFLSTIVYYCTKMKDFSLVPTVRSWQANITMPDITIVLVSDTIITEKESYKELDVFEKDVDFTRNLNKGFKMISNGFKFAKPIETIFANDTIDNVSKKIQESLKENFII